MKNNDAPGITLIPVGLAVGVGIGVAIDNLAFGIGIGLVFGGLSSVIINIRNKNVQSEDGGDENA